MLKKLFSLFAALTLSVGLWAENEFKIVNANGFQQPVNRVAQVISATNTDSCGQIVNFPYYNDFENFAEEQDCWVSIDNDGDGQTWITGTLNHAGAKFGMDASICLISQSYENSSSKSFNADNYLLTPEIVLPANKIVTLSWYAKSQDSSYPDWYEVMVAPNASTEISSFVSVFNEKGASDWTLRTVNLSAYAGTTIRVVFHHQDYDSFLIDIDNLGIECETPTTGLENVKADMKANKIIKNGKMYLRDGKGEWVNILGF